MILEDIGEKLEFEGPFWDGQHPLYEDDDESRVYPLRFYPMELGEAALFEFFGYQIEGGAAELFAPDSVELMTFEVRPWWKFW